MRKFLHFIVFALVLIATTVVVSTAATNTTYTDDNGLTWKVTLYESTSKATITGVGQMDGGNFVNLTERTKAFEMPSYLVIQGTKYTVTAIADNAFATTKSNNRAAAITNKGFYTENIKDGNYSDVTVRFPEDAIRIFGHLTLPEKLESIGAKAFYGCAIYDKVTIPETVTHIGDAAFAYCAGILEVEIKAPEDCLLDGCITECNRSDCGANCEHICKHITAVPKECFYMCNSLTTFKTDIEITKYGDCAFESCYALIDIEISENVTSIGQKAFYKCKAIPTELNFPNLTSIGQNAFANCFFLERINLGKADFNTNVINECNRLKSITVSDDNPKYKTVDGVLYSKDGKTLYLYPRDKDGDLFEIPEGVVTISGSACYLADFKKVVFPSTLTTIGGSAFRYSNLENVYVPDSVTSVGDNAFNNCSALVWIVFGKNVSTLRGDHVGNLSALKCVYYFPSSTVSGYPGNSAKCFKIDAKTISECRDHLYGYKDTAPTCLDAGENICLVCDKKTSVSPIEHVGQVVAKSTLSCVTNESTFVKCDYCYAITGDLVEVIEIACAGQHDAVTKTVTNENGISYTYSKCSVCHETFLADGSYASSIIVGGDLNDDGKINADDLALLGKYISGQNVSVKALAGDLNDDGKVDVADYLIFKKHLENWGVEISTTTKTCKNHLHIGTRVVQENDCVYDGLKVLYCLDCGEKLAEITSPHTGHDWEYLANTDATCYKEGSYARSCKTCKAVENGVVPKTEHTYSWWTLTDEFDYQYSYCKICVANNIKTSNGNYQIYRQKIDRSELDEMLTRISEHYAVYYTTESINYIRPIYQSANQALTQEQVDQLVASIQESLPKLEYNIDDVPNIYIETSKTLSKDFYSPANVIVAYKDSTGASQSVTDYEATIKRRGNSTNRDDKTPYNIKFSKETDLLESGTGKKYTLLANYYDDSLIRTALAYEMANAFGIKNTSHYRFVNIYVNGVYKGNYMLVSPPDKIAEYAVNINEDEDFILQYSYSSGWNANKEVQITSPIFKFYMQIDSHDAADMTRQGWSNLFKTMYQSDFALLSGDDNEIEKYFDLESLRAYFLMHEYTKNKDIIWDSLRFYIADCKIHGGPTWDCDLTLGNISYFNYTAGSEPDTQHIYWNTVPGVSNGIHHNSATGTWANLDWAATTYKSETPDNPYRVWFHDLFYRSEKFKRSVIEYMFNEQDTISSIYKDIVDKDGKVVTVNMIDRITDGQVISIVNNFTIFNFGNKDGGLHYNAHSFTVEDTYTDEQLKQMYGPLLSITDPNTSDGMKTITLRQPAYHGEALDFLREWCQMRNEWLLEYYAQTYPEYVPDNY